MLIEIPEDTIEIIHAYEGLIGEKKGRYFEYQGKADPKGVYTIGRGHKLSRLEREKGRFKNGLTLEEVNQLFARDIQPRALRLGKLIPDRTEQEFAAALSFFYNNEYAWGPKGSPGKYHRAGLKKDAAASFLLYIYSGKPKKKRLGLWRRRATEALYYLTGEVLVSKTAADDKSLVHELTRAGVTSSIPG
ncbi:MAG: lysozyme [Candidatus Obscuribacterales bacterium]